VIVTLNYRLGAFGFLAHPELAKEAGHSGSGNYGMMDALAALKWVKRNISAFGGDPNNVTIFGESAGAIMIGAIVGSPQFKGTFQRAIVESGAWMGLYMGRLTTTEQAQGAGAKALEAAGKTIGELRRMPLAELPALGGAGLVIDGYMIPEDLSITFTNGKQNDVDVIAGSNKDENTFFGGGGRGRGAAGIDYNHPDLNANVWSAPTAFTVTIGGTTITCAAGTHGFNAITKTCDPLDDNDHGSHVSEQLAQSGTTTSVLSG
jgi:carboxylesterase type B